MSLFTVIAQDAAVPAAKTEPDIIIIIIVIVILVVLVIVIIHQVKELQFEKGDLQSRSRNVEGAGPDNAQTSPDQCSNSVHPCRLTTDKANITYLLMFVERAQEVVDLASHQCIDGKHVMKQESKSQHKKNTKNKNNIQKFTQKRKNK